MTDFLDAGWGVRIGTPALREHHSLVDLLDWDDHQQYVPRRGFIDPSEVTVAFNNVTRIFTVTPVGASFRLAINGVCYVLTDTYQVMITNMGAAEGLWYIRFVVIGGTILLAASQNDFDLDTEMPVAIVYWDSTNNQSIYEAYERHGLTYPSRVHYWAHRTIGAVYETGLALVDYTIVGTGAANADATVALSEGVIWDEDIRIHIRNCGEIIPGDFYQTITGVALIPVYYKTGAQGYWRRKAANGYALLDPAFTGFVRMAYNFNPGAFWNPQVAAQNAFVAVWIVATNNRQQPIIALCGQREDATLNAARTNNTYEGLDLGVGGLGIIGPPFREFRQLYRLIFQTNSTYANVPKARLRDVLDLRRITTIPSGTYAVTNHSSLSGLGRDDHPQYLLGGALVTRVALTASQNDYAPANIQTTQQLLLDPDAAWSITGIIAPDGTYREDGKILIVTNVDAAFDITLNNENAGSAAANRLALGGDDITLGPGQSIMLMYDLTSLRWRPAGGSGGGNVPDPVSAGSIIVSSSGAPPPVWQEMGLGTVGQVLMVGLATPATPDWETPFLGFSVTTPAQITANQNDYEPASLQTSMILRLSTDASRNITGIKALNPTNRGLMIVNVGANDLVLKNEDGASVAANRFAIGIDMTLAANEGCTLFYDGTSARWRCVGRHI